MCHRSGYTAGIWHDYTSQKRERRLHGEPRWIRYGCCDAPVDVYEPNRKNLKSHQDVVTKVMERYDIIPMSFGNVLEGKKMCIF
ncbi:GvpL/GvpF family gas vesicle protein [Sinobaca sp. H24]|uniref:GvpL/GvpF family gas vesicle protein n=1 Tax=Sinobaca sp. H24 TaxID=2923376 RepID=UPI0020796D7E|nr:GvpL/GvpF family gas vesicle protein [Sinobaca sp. H24]